MYIAAVLTALSQHELFAALSNKVAIPADWLKYGHHMTVKFNNLHEVVPGYYPHNVELGMSVSLIVTHFKKDQYGCAVVVDPIPNKEALRICNPIPHITIAVAPGIKPFYSNDLLSYGDWIEMSGDMLMLDAYLIQVPSSSYNDGTTPEVAARLAVEPYC